MEKAAATATSATTSTATSTATSAATSTAAACITSSATATTATPSRCSTGTYQLNYKSKSPKRNKNVRIFVRHLQIAPPPLVVGNTSAEILQSTDVFRAKNDNVKELEANRLGGKVARPKVDPSTGVAKPLSADNKSIQNKVNNNAIETRLDETAKPKRASIEIEKPTQKPISGVNASDIANKSNNNVAILTAPKILTKESTKKKSKEKDQKAAEEKRRQHEEDEERKRLELIAAQRRAKLIDQNTIRTEPGPKRNNLAASVGKFVSPCEISTPTKYSYAY